MNLKTWHVLLFALALFVMMAVTESKILLGIFIFFILVGRIVLPIRFFWAILKMGWHLVCAIYYLIAGNETSPAPDSHPGQPESANPQ